MSKGGNAIAAVCSSPSPSPTTREPLVIFSSHHFHPNLDSPIWREQEEPNLPLLPGCKRVLREVPVQSPTSESPRSEAVSPPAKPAPKNPPARRYLTRSGGRPLQKRARVESLEPIDFTEQSPVPSPEPSPAPSPVPSPAPPAQPQELQPPLSEPQIPSGVAPEVIIRRPMLTQPPIEGNLDCRARPFHSEL